MKNKPTTTNDYQRRVNLVVEYIREHLDREINLRSLSDVSAFSPCHLHRMLTAFLGEPVGEFIGRTRVETAARLLRYSDASVSEIAYRVEYDAPSSLTKLFRRAFGVSPQTYRTIKICPTMTDVRHASSEIRLSRAKILEIPSKMVAYIRTQGDYNSVNSGDYFNCLWCYVKEHKLFSAGN